MTHLNKIPILLVILILLSKPSYADWQDRHGRDDRQARHEDHHWRVHNPDLVLVSGMDTIDTRVLVDPALEQATDVIDQPAPADAAAVAQDVNAVEPVTMNGSYIIDVPNQAGGYTPIVIKKWGSGYVGPQGEFYYPFPDVSQLQTMYGL